VLAANIEYDAMSMYQDVYNQVSNPGSAMTVANAVSLNKSLTDTLAPTSNRCLNMNTQDNGDIVNAVGGLFNDQSKVSQTYREGRVANNSFGFKDIMENTLWPRHTTGSCAASTGYLVNGASQTGASLTIDTGSNTFLKGDIITIAGVNRVHPETKANTGQLQQFVVTADSGSTATSLAISPSIVTLGARQNVSGSPADNAAITKVGGANATHNVTMAYHRDAFAFATADLIMPEDKDWCARENHDGLSLRIVRAYDINNDKFPCRIDIMYGYKTLREELAARGAFN
jgi:hypothetical protein